MMREQNTFFFSSKCHSRCIYILLVLISFVCFQVSASPAVAKSNPRYASLVMDADTGVILHERYADKFLHPASLTKIMTLLMTFEALQQGKIGLDDRVTISRHAASMVPSKLDLPVGSGIRVKDAIYALVTKSANDVAVALAEHLGGTESNFARMMTHRARLIGMDRTTFRNASGLHDPKQVSTARDMAKLARLVITNYPSYYRYFATKNFTYQGKTYRNHNRLLGQYKGMDGMKTGYVGASGFNLVASAVRNNRRLIGVVFGGRSSVTRNNHMVDILDRGFDKINDIRIAQASVPLPDRKPVMFLASNSASVRPGVPAGASSGMLTAATPDKTGARIQAERLASSEKYSFSPPDHIQAYRTRLDEGKFAEIIGQGDYDPAVSRRIETGLIAIAAHKNEPVRHYQAPPRAREAAVPSSAVSQGPRGWAIQVGAFSSRAQTDYVLNKTLKELPREYANASPIIAPLKTEKGWVFRARLSGYTKYEAFGACQHLNGCMAVAPR